MSSDSVSCRVPLLCCAEQAMRAEEPRLALLSEPVAQQFTPLAEASSLGYRPPALSLDQFLGAGQDHPGRFRSHWGIENDLLHV